MKRERVTIAMLRREAPRWRWRAKQTGFGRWEYRGFRLGYFPVTVYAVARLCGPAEDDFETEWRADNGRSACGLASFLVGGT